MNKQERDKRRRASILEFLRDNPGSNRSAIIEGVWPPTKHRGLHLDAVKTPCAPYWSAEKVNKQMVTNLLGQLRDTGSIRKEGDRRSTTWFVVSPEEPREVRAIHREQLVLHDRLLERKPISAWPEDLGYNNAKKRMDNALLAIDGYVTTLEEALADERSRPKVNQEYGDLRSAVYNFLEGKTTVADLREALGDDE